MMVPNDRTERYDGTPRSLFVDAVVPAFERLIASGRIKAWGISALGVPASVIETFADNPPPTAVQAVANLLDPLDERREPPKPGPPDIIAAAKRSGVAVMGIRAVQAGH